MLHVLVVSNRGGERKRSTAAVFIDRQIASLRDLDVKISTFDLGSSQSPSFLFRKWRELIREVRKLNPHIVHARYGSIVAALAVSAGRPAVITFCGSDLNPGASISPLRMFVGFLLSNLAALRARGIICVSQNLVDALWWHRSRAVIIPDGIDLQLFSPGSRAEARESLGWHPTRRILLFNLGGDEKKKGFALAKAAVDIVRSHIPDVEFKVTTDVDPNQMPLFYRAADVLLCTSPYEGSPNVVKEALACNLPVVSTPVGDVPERLAGVHPSAVAPPDPNALGEAVVQILSMNKRSNGREHITNLDLTAVARQVKAVYEKIQNRRTEAVA